MLAVSNRKAGIVRTRGIRCLMRVALLVPEWISSGTAAKRMGLESELL